MESPKLSPLPSTNQWHSISSKHKRQSALVSSFSKGTTPIRTKPESGLKSKIKKNEPALKLEELRYDLVSLIKTVRVEIAYKIQNIEKDFNNSAPKNPNILNSNMAQVLKMILIFEHSLTVYMKITKTLPPITMCDKLTGSIAHFYNDKQVLYQKTDKDNKDKTTPQKSRALGPVTPP